MPPNVGCPCGIEPKVGLVDSPNEGVGDDVLGEPIGALAGASTGGEDSDCELDSFKPVSLLINEPHAGQVCEPIKILVPQF